MRASWLLQAERKSIADAKRAIAMLEEKLKAGLVSASTAQRLLALAGGSCHCDRASVHVPARGAHGSRRCRVCGVAACGVYDFRTANATQLDMAKLDWNDHKEWLKGVKQLITIGLKKYPAPAAIYGSS